MPYVTDRYLELMSFEFKCLHFKDHEEEIDEI